MKTITLSLLLLASANTWAIKYYQGASEIDAGKFDACGKIYYRNVAKNELSAEHQKNLVKATLKGELVNDIGAVTAKVKAEGACTYTDNSESIK